MNCNPYLNYNVQPQNYQGSFIPNQSQIYPNSIPNYPNSIPNQTQVSQCGFIGVQNEQEARLYPVGPGNSITFRDESAPYIGVCGLITAVAAAVAIVAKLIQKWRLPNKKQNERLEEHEKRLKEVEARLDEGNRQFKADNERTSELEEDLRATTRMIIEALQALMAHALDGNNTDELSQSHYASLEGVQFDAPEPDNTLGSGGVKDNNVASYGYNRWSESGIRAWLNSDQAKGNWFGAYFERGGSQVARRAADIAPDQHSTVNGFLKGLDPDFVAILGEIQVETSCNTITDSGVTDTTYDKIFLPSLEQIYCTPEAAGVEGDYWEYWKERLGLTSPASYYPTTYPNYIMYALENHSSAQYVRLRSAYRGYSCNAWGA